MDRRILHIGTGDINGIILDVLSATVDGLAGGTSRMTPNVNTALAEYSRAAGEPDSVFDFVPFFAHFEVIADSLVTLATTVSIGTNSPNWNNILAATVLTGLTTTGKQGVVLPALGYAKIANGDTANVKVTSVGLGVTLTLTANLFGAFQKQ